MVNPGKLQAMYPAKQVSFQLQDVSSWVVRLPNYIHKKQNSVSEDSSYAPISPAWLNAEHFSFGCLFPLAKPHNLFSYFLSAVVPLPPGNESVTYYLLHNGSDTSDCGGSVDSACFSLLHILNLYYAKPPEMGLEVIVDYSLVIGDKTMVSFFTILNFISKEEFGMFV